MNKFDIVLINFPFTDLTSSKIRPGLIIKTLEGENLILCQITTKRRNISKYEVKLDENSCEGDIRFNSNIYIDMIFTLHKTLIINKLGSIKNKSTINEINSKIKQMFCD